MEEMRMKTEEEIKEYYKKVDSEFVEEEDNEMKSKLLGFRNALDWVMEE